MKQRHGNTAVISEVLTAVLLCIQVIWKDTILTGTYSSYQSFDGSECSQCQELHGSYLRFDGSECSQCQELHGSYLRFDRSQCVHSAENYTVVAEVLMDHSMFTVLGTTR